MRTTMREGEAARRGPGRGRRTPPPAPLELLGAPSLARILRYYLLRPNAAPHARHLQQVLELSGGSLQRDLDKLTTLGVLDRVPDGYRVRYRAAPRPRLWAGLQLLVAETTDPVQLLAEALRDVAGVEAAFVFGSTARGTARADSDLDVFVVEDAGVDRRALYGQLAEVGALVGREVNSVRYTRQALAERIGTAGHAAGHFVREVLTGPKHWIAGSPDVIRPLATAAGLTLATEPAVAAAMSAAG